LYGKGRRIPFSANSPAGSTVTSSTAEAPLEADCAERCKAGEMQLPNPRSRQADATSQSTPQSPRAYGAPSARPGVQGRQLVMTPTRRRGPSPPLDRACRTVLQNSRKPEQAVREPAAACPDRARAPPYLSPHKAPSTLPPVREPLRAHARSALLPSPDFLRAITTQSHPRCY
jgi:hypothetical protein